MCVCVCVAALGSDHGVGHHEAKLPLVALDWTRVYVASTVVFVCLAQWVS